jgi:thioredoxin reductase/ferredoxin
MPFNPLFLVYLLPLAGIWIFTEWRARQRTARSSRILQEAVAAGLTEPPSLHPLIDTALCLGCGSCVTACPEKSVLGLIDGKAQLIDPTMCIGHGACASACPTQGITLVFGTETRGVDIPFVSPRFETNVPGLYIAGELGGMGLIRNAATQGKQAIDNIAKAVQAIRFEEECLDVLIVGAGPAGISASLGALQHKLRFRTIEQDSLGGTVAHYPRGKLVMTAPTDLPLAGQMRFGEVSKEELLAFWQDITERFPLDIGYHERLESVERFDGLFRATTTRGTFVTKTILLAIGRRGTPRKLDVPGEDLNKVVYRLIEPEQYRGQHVLIVGGGDSALEAATSIAEQPGSIVTLSYRASAFSRARAKNRQKVEEAAAQGQITLLLGSEVQEILPASAHLHTAQGHVHIPNDAVIICAGGVLPTGFLRDLGVSVETKHGTR